MPHIAYASFSRFAKTHDDLPAFHAAYLVLTILAAALLNLGFFAMIIGIHMALDIVKYREYHGFTWKRTFEGVIRESVVDVTLLSMGLVFAIFLHPSLTGMMGMQGLMLAEVTILRAVGVMTPKLKIVFEFLKILSHLDHYMTTLHPRLGKHTSMIEYVCMFSLCVTMGMLISAPLLLDITVERFLGMLVSEMLPWKF